MLCFCCCVRGACTQQCWMVIARFTLWLWGLWMLCSVGTHLAVPVVQPQDDLTLPDIHLDLIDFPALDIEDLNTPHSHSHAHHLDPLEVDDIEESLFLATDADPPTFSLSRTTPSSPPPPPTIHTESQQAHHHQQHQQQHPQPELSLRAPQPLFDIFTAQLPPTFLRKPGEVGCVLKYFRTFLTRLSF